jgi:hypothetical protein
MSDQKARPANAYCSFCRKSYRDIGPLVEGPSEVYICGACIELCQEIIDQEKLRRALALGYFRGKLERLIGVFEQAKKELPVEVVEKILFHLTEVKGLLVGRAVPYTVEKTSDLTSDS